MYQELLLAHQVRLPHNAMHRGFDFAAKHCRLVRATAAITAGRNFLLAARRMMRTPLKLS
jgi:hypothetical protein